MAPVQHIASVDAYRAAVSSAGRSLVVVKFTAAWCGPCRAIAPVVTELANANPDVVFLEVDVDVVSDLALALGIRAMPTFWFLREGQKLHAFSGANEQMLRQAVAQHRGAAPAASGSAAAAAGAGAGAAASAAAASAFPIPGGFGSLKSEIRKFTVLNERRDRNSAALFEDSPGLLESDCDEQLLVHVEFSQMVKLHSIKFDVGPQHATEPRAPATVRLFVNQPSLDFESVGSAKVAQVLQLTPADFAPSAVTPLKMVAFMKTNSLDLFVESNQGDAETTVLRRLVLIGAPIATSNMAEFQRVAGEKGEADH